VCPNRHRDTVHFITTGCSKIYYGGVETGSCQLVFWLPIAPVDCSYRCYFLYFKVYLAIVDIRILYHMYRHRLQFMILLSVFSLEAAAMSILSRFNEMVNAERGGVCCTLDCEAILSLRSATFKLDQCTRSYIELLGLVRPSRRCRGDRLKVKLNQYSGIPVLITNRCKQNSAASTQYDRQRVLRPINRRMASPVKVGVFNACSVASQHGSPSTD